MENKNRYCVEVTFRDDLDDFHSDNSICSELTTLEDANRTLDQLEYTMRNHPVIRINESTTNLHNSTQHTNPVLIPIYAIAYAKVVEVGN